MLTVKDLKKRFSSGDHIINAIDCVSFTIPESSFVAVIGKSGSGKSTLLGLLGTLDKPTSGDIQVAGQNVVGLSGRQLVAYRRNAIGFIFQSYNLIPNLTALQNVMLPMEFDGVSQPQRKRRAAGLLARVGLTGALHNRKPGRLSGGEQQRVAIARALANRPKLILADEPTGNLDTNTGNLIIDLLYDLAKTEKAVVIAVTHDSTIASKADKTFHLKDGELVS